jgi:hypothetical protein
MIWLQCRALGGFMMRLFLVIVGFPRSIPAGRGAGAWKVPSGFTHQRQVIPRTTPVIQVVGMMRSITSALGVRCQFCHVGEEGMPLEQFDFAKDEKRAKLVARQMMRMLEEINRRLDTLLTNPTTCIRVWQ